jgi:hypothetical protein
MSVQQIESWKNFAIAILPTIILLVTAILIYRKQRGSYSLILLISAIVAFVFPLISQLIISSLLGLADQLNALPSSQQQAALEAQKPHVNQYNYYRSLFGQGAFIANLVFAVALFLVVKPLLSPKDTVISTPGSSSAGSADNSPEATH